MSRGMPLTAVGTLVCALTACGSGISGDYGGDECLYDKLTFAGDDTAYVTMFGTEQAAQYRIDGDRVILTAGDGQSIVFTRNGNNLEAALLGERMVCAEL